MFSGQHLLVGISLLIGIVASSHASELPLNGAARYQELGKEKFIAALYLEAPSSTPATIYGAQSGKRMQIQLTSHYSKRRWVNLWMQGMAINNNSESFNQVADELVALFEKQQGSLQPNDIVEIYYTPSANTAYSVNGVTLASEMPPALFNLFLSAWIGQVPPSSGFRDAILGLSDNSHLAGSLATIQPNASRIEAIQAWLEPETEDAELAAQAEEAAPSETESATTELAIDTESAPEEDTLLAKATDDSESLATPEQVTDDTNELSQPAELASTSSTEDPPNNAEETADFAEEEEEVTAVSVEMIMALKEYTRDTVKQVYQAISYPRSAQRRGHEGQVRLLLTLNRTGNLVDVTATDESEYESLNKAAFKAVSKAAPFAAIPNAITDDPLELTIPITFRLQ